ncbi:unnamed protein product [Prunus armeniaca]
MLPRKTGPAAIKTVGLVLGGIFSKKGASGFSASSTAEEVAEGIDATGLTAIVTGAASGIDVETSRVLALHGVHVVMAVRNKDAGTNVKEAILKEIPRLKLMSWSIMATPFKLSQDNIELHFATNHLGHFLLTDLLLETMKSTSRERKTEERIVNVSSLGHRYGYREGFCFDKINDESRYHRYYAYGQSKLANILHANELTRRLKEEGAEVTANSLHPGTILTNLMRYDGFLKCILKVLGIFISKTVQQGAATTCFVALHPQLKGVGGKYFVDCNIAKPSSQAKDADLATRLWDFSLSLTNAK